MPLKPGSYALGPDDATLTVKTERKGAAAKAGHDLVIDVTSWSATLDVGAEPSATALSLTADSRSLRVRAGTGGMTSLGDEEKAAIAQTIDDEILEGAPIEFRSSGVEAGVDGGLRVTGDLAIGDARHPVAFDLAVDGDGRLTGGARLLQTDWGIKPYSALFGALKVADEVEVVVDATLPAGAAA
jgi:polyisoprenoid-binding protein YceI